MDVNFQRIIKHLQKRGMSQEAIANRVGCRQSNISAIMKKNREPRYFLGDRLVKLWEKEVLGQ